VLGAHAPTRPGTSQASHCPAQAEVQHTPSTQNCELHCEGWSQLAPFDRFGTHRPPLHQWPSAQSVSAAQSPAQALAPHT
jgi:hypothetical protein